MAEGVRLRRIADPVLAAPPAGARVRTRIHVTAAEAAALTTIGDFWGRCIAESWPNGSIAAFWTTTAGRRGAASVSE